MFTLFQVALVCLMAAYMTQRSLYYHRRNRQSWSDITGRIRPDAGAWSEFHNAGLVMEMCDYVEMHGLGLARVGELTALRSDAMQVRASVLTAWTTKR